MTHVYEYRVTKLNRGLAPWAPFTAHVLGDGMKAIAEHDGGLCGLWRPQLGFASDEAVTMTVWPKEGTGWRQGHRLIDGIAHETETSHVDLLKPTARPVSPNARPAPGGIYVHRWFHVDAHTVDQFVALSAEAWESFETSFDAAIYGLFEAEPTPDDDFEKRRRLLLVTRYGNHGVWEASRNEAADPEAWQRFLKRHEMTRSTIGRSCLLVTGD